jgi:hypothetical protein
MGEVRARQARCLTRLDSPGTRRHDLHGLYSTCQIKFWLFC